MTTRIPAFTDIAFAAREETMVPASEASAWQTPEGIAVKPVYGADDIARLDFLDGMPGVAPTSAALPHDVCAAAVDRPAIFRLLHAELVGQGLCE